MFPVNAVHQRAAPPPYWKTHTFILRVFRCIRLLFLILVPCFCLDVCLFNFSKFLLATTSSTADHVRPRLHHSHVPPFVAHSSLTHMEWYFCSSSSSNPPLQRYLPHYHYCLPLSVIRMGI